MKISVNIPRFIASFIFFVSLIQGTFYEALPWIIGFMLITVEIEFKV